MIAESHVAELEPRLEKYLSLVLMTELLFGAGHLIGNSKPVECIRKYEPKFRELLADNQWLVEPRVEGHIAEKRPVKGTNFGFVFFSPFSSLETRIILKKFESR